MSGWMSAHPRLRTGLLVVVGALVGLLVLAFALAGIGRITGDGEPATGAAQHVTSSPSTEASTSPSRSAVATQPTNAATTPESDGAEHGALPVLPETDDPDAYATAIAEVLFGMEHASYRPGDYEAVFEAALWDEIVPEDRSRIMATISRRIPTADMWEQMRSIEQVSEFEVELVWEPRTGQEHPEAGDWPDGVVTRNVSGTQTETWQAPDQDVQTSTRPVAVTIAVACPPATSPCRLVGILPNVGT